MKRIESILAIFLVMEIVVGSSSAQSQREVQSSSRGVEFSIRVDKKRYMAGQEIIVDLKITNMTDAPLQVIDLNNAGGNVMVSRTLLFSIIGPDGKEVPYDGAKEDWYPRFEKHGRWLKSNESMHSAIEINNKKARRYYRLSQLGNYQITGRYYGFSNKNPLSRLGIFSNTITVYIGGDI